MSRVITYLVALSFAAIPCRQQAFADSLLPQDDCSSGVIHPDFSLRSDFNDLGPLVCPMKYFYAQGGTASLVYNALTPQTGVALDGLAALSLRYYQDFPTTFDRLPHFLGFAVGPYVQGDNTYQLLQTTMPSRNSYTVTSGAFAQIAITDPFVALGQDSFRLRGGQTDGSNGIYSTTVVGEWIPYYGWIGPINIGGTHQFQSTPILYAFVPELMVQYDHLDGGPNKYLLFASNSEAMRIGPEAVFYVNLSERYLESYFSPKVANDLANFAALITFHEDWDTYTGRNFYWAGVSLTYNFERSNFGITASYGYGNLEATGNLANQVKLGLAAKF